MQHLDVSFTLTPALVLTALVFDAGLVMLAISAVRHMRSQRVSSSAQADTRSAAR